MKKSTIRKRFWSKTSRIGECLIFTGYKDQAGYGIFRFNGKLEKAHRVAYQLMGSKISPGLHVCHKCDNPSCVQPTHLFIGTHMDNMRDMVRKGRNVSPDIKGVDRYNALLTPEAVKEIREAFKRPYRGLQKDLVEKYNVSRATIYKVVHRKTWNHI